MILSMILLPLIPLLFGFGIGMHLLWIGAAVLAVVWVLGFGRTCRAR